MKLADGSVITSNFRAKPHELQHGVGNVTKSTALKIGTIAAVRYVDSKSGMQKSQEVNADGVTGSPYETVYDVRVDDHNARPVIYNGVRALKPFFGCNNFFDMIHESAAISPAYVQDGPTGLFVSAAESLVGARCVLACIENNPTSGVILGFLQHPARPSTITESMGIHLAFEFNGIGVTIDNAGMLTLTAKGPKTPPVGPPTGSVPEGVNTGTLGPFTVTMTDGLFKLADAGSQFISIDRTAGIEVSNGSEFIKIVGGLVPGTGEMTINVGGAMTVAAGEGSYGFTKKLELSTADLKIDASVQTNWSTGNFSAKCEFGFSVDAKTVSLKGELIFAVESKLISLKGGGGTEVLATIFSLFDELSKVIINSPAGPCSPVSASPQWAAVAALMAKLKAITG